jgi:hypothetical protein
LIDWRCRYQLELFGLELSRLLHKVAGIASVQYGQDIALDLFVLELVLRLVPIGFRVSDEPLTLGRIIAGREFQKPFVFIVVAMACIVYDEQAMRAIVIAYEVGDMAVQLMLRLLLNIKLDDLGLVVESVAEEFVEFVGL